MTSRADKRWSSAAGSGYYDRPDGNSIFGGHESTVDSQRHGRNGQLQSLAAAQFSVKGAPA